MARGIGLAGGFGAGGVRDALVDILAQRMAQAQFDEQKRARGEEESQGRAAMQQRMSESAQRGQEHSERLKLDLDELGVRREQGAQRIGLDREQLELQKRPPKPRTMTIETIDPTTRRPTTRVLPEDEALGQSFEKYVAPREPREPREEQIVQVMGPNGAPIWVRKSDAIGKPAAQAARAVTGAERQSLAYYNRAKEAVDTLTNLGANGRSLEQRIAGQGTAGQFQGQYAPNILQTSEQQSYRQAQRAFTEARLRKESGAAIPTDEYEKDASTYFAQPGDSAQLIEQKRKARNTVLAGLKFSAGKAFDEFYGEDSTLSGAVDIGADTSRGGATGGGGQQFDFDPKTGKLVPRR